MLSLNFVWRGWESFTEEVEFKFGANTPERQVFKVPRLSLQVWCGPRTAWGPLAGGLGRHSPVLLPGRARLNGAGLVCGERLRRLEGRTHAETCIRASGRKNPGTDVLNENRGSLKGNLKTKG